MLWKVAGVAVAQTTAYWIVYAVWGAVDKELTSDTVQCRGKMSFAEYCAWQLSVDACFVALVALALAAVFLVRILVARMNVRFLGLDRAPDLRSNMALLRLVAVYSAVAHAARFTGEAVKSFVNYENFLYDTLPKKTADAIRACEKSGPDNADYETAPDSSEDGCPVYPEDLEEISPGIGAPGLASRPRALARHAIRQSLVHWITVVYTILAVLLFRGIFIAIGDWWKKRTF